jgi:1,2-phenylacetyl-CoA epoxidase PaaB subunit
MDDEEQQYRDYRVWMRSVPGMYEQYDGKVDVWATSEEDAINKAHDKLKRGSFPDRTRNMWRVEKVEIL